MTEFILNNTKISTNESKGITLLDFIRYNKRLVGTKIGCREGDCGACTVLIGSLVKGKVVYKSMTSCITPLGNAQGKHVVTVEGLNMGDLSPVQQAMVDNSGTQCGFCTPGFVVSLSGFALSDEKPTCENTISSIDGNICRCTGYKSIERAAEVLTNQLATKQLDNSVEWAIENGFVPQYFSEIASKLQKINCQSELVEDQHSTLKTKVAGGTDLYVQKHDTLHDADIDFVFDREVLNGIEVKNGVFTIKGASTASDLMNSEDLQRVFPNLRKHLKLVSSTPIRNMGTVAGNFVNASPIGDLTAFFIALDASIKLSDGNKSREIKLKDLYKGYKNLTKTDAEHIESLSFEILDANTHFNFEKISKRTYLDIASVNSAMRISVENDVIKDIHISAGGVGPTPMRLNKTCEYLVGKHFDKLSVTGGMNEVFEIMNSEIAPISDARGEEQYKRLALRQLVYAHFMELFPATFKIEELVNL